MLNVGLEVELFGVNYSFRDILQSEELSLDKFKTRDGVKVKLSEEYYSNTIEYNFGITDDKEIFDKQIKYLEKQIDKYDFRLNCVRPQFVGTHIHIFNCEYLGSSYNKDKLLLSVLGYILKNKDCLSDLSKERLIYGHQLWANYSNKRDNDWYRLVTGYGQVAYYESASSKAKYRPIIISKATDAGKPKSLEIRIIPNEFLFNGKLKELLELIESGEIFKYKIDNYLDFFRELGGWGSVRRMSASNSYGYSVPGIQNIYANIGDIYIQYEGNNVEFLIFASVINYREGLLKSILGSVYLDTNYIKENLESVKEFIKRDRVIREYLIDKFSTTEIINRLPELEDVLFP